MGCYKDRYPDRAIPTLEGNAEVKNILTGHYKRRVNALGKCMNAAKHIGATVFALQDGGQCFASKKAKVAALRYGKTIGCGKDGKGGALASDVYEIV